MKKDEIVAYLDGFIDMVDAPVLERLSVERVSAARATASIAIATTQGDFTADQVVVASGGYHTPIVPRMAERLPRGSCSCSRRRTATRSALPEGAVLVVGYGQSGAQIAEDLHLAGRKVFLAIGDAPRCARFYRGRDVVDWLADMELLRHAGRKASAARRRARQHQPLRDGPRRRPRHRPAQASPLEGMELYGRLDDLRDGQFQFSPNLRGQSRPCGRYV